MIKINLANSLLAKSGGGIQATAVVSDISGSKIALKAALILVPIIGMVIFEKRSLAAKDENLKNITVQQDVLSKELQSVGSVDDIVRQVNEQRRDLDEKFGVMGQIFGVRSQKIQSLFSVQNSISDKSWLTRVAFEEKNLLMTGYASSIDEAQALVTSLSQDKALFSSVSMTNVKSETINGNDFFKFEIMVKLKE